jgi:2-desacetyl-2-hydroxyethyl bacteriochlorophyllide A dehydrogenase
MKALVFHGPRDIRYEEYADPILKFDHAVILRVTHCSICGSDLHIYHGDKIGKTDYSADIDTFCVGHEFIGEVIEKGSNVHRFNVGDRVIAAGGSGCGECAACLSRVGNCSRSTAFGLSARLQGGQAEYAQVPNADVTLMKIPDGVSNDQAVLLTDALATAHYGVGRADIAPGGTVAIVGLGPIGLLGIELAFIRGASRVFAIDPVETRRTHAESLGAIALSPDNARASITEITKGGACDSIFEASGARSAIDLVPSLARHGATASFIGLPQGDTAVPMRNIIYRNLTVRAGIANVTAQWAQLVPLLQTGRVKGDGLFTHRLPLSAGAEGYRMFDAREDGVMKVMFQL